LGARPEKTTRQCAPKARDCRVVWWRRGESNPRPRTGACRASTCVVSWMDLAPGSPRDNGPSASQGSVSSVCPVAQLADQPADGVSTRPRAFRVETWRYLIRPPVRNHCWQVNCLPWRVLRGDQRSPTRNPVADGTGRIQYAPIESPSLARAAPRLKCAAREPAPSRACRPSRARPGACRAASCRARGRSRASRASPASRSRGAPSSSRAA
jgi:hypothetical protein